MRGGDARALLRPTPAKEKRLGAAQQTHSINPFGTLSGVFPCFHSVKYKPI
jgi:hypothetical protein